MRLYRFDVMYLYIFIMCSVYCVSSIAHTGPLHLIDSAGICKSKPVIESYICSDSVKTRPSYNKMVHLLDFTGDNDASRIINNAFGTCFKHVKGLQLATTSKGIVTYSMFTTLYSDRFCGLDAGVYCSSIGGHLVLCMKTSSLNSSLKYFGGLTQEVLHRKVTSNNSSSLHSLTVLVERDSMDDDSAGPSQVEQRIKHAIGHKLLKNYESLPIKAFVVDTTDTKSWKSAAERIVLGCHRSALDKEEKNPAVSSHILRSTWLKIRTGFNPTPYYGKTPQYQDALACLVQSYHICAIHSDKLLSEWFSRVSRGKVICKFASRAKALLRGIAEELCGNASFEAIAKDGLERFQELKEHILSNIIEVHKQQLVIVERRIEASLKGKLLSLVSNVPEGNILKNKVPSQMLEKAIDEYRALTSDLNDAYLQLHDDNVEFRTRLQRVIETFPESGAYKLEEINSGENPVKDHVGSPLQGKNGREKSVKVALGLVGMLRPPGFGNLQGFLGYAANVMGVPLELILGVQNDGDSPEIMGDDREHALLRLQPKINFDVVM